MIASEIVVEWHFRSEFDAGRNGNRLSVFGNMSTRLRAVGIRG
jgi:hypothetical protein